MRRFVAIVVAVSLVYVCGTPGAPGAGTARSSAAPTVVVAPTIRVAHPEQSAPVPIGWKLSDLPTFLPAPLPEPVVLPPAQSATYLGRIPTTQRVAFLTIDDGFVKTAEAPKLIAAAHIPLTLFLTSDAIRENPAYFAPMRANGAVIEAHTITHPELRGRSYAFQKNEICGSADRIGTFYGRRPVLFRPPFGDKDATTLRVVKDCGMRAAIFWRETVNEGKVRYQEGDAVQPGDIILMHFRPTFVKDFLGALRAIHRAGLTPALLEDYFTTP